MQKFTVNKELYLTFLTNNDSYMVKVPEEETLTLVNGDLCYKGKISIDSHIGYLYHNYISPFSDNGSRTVL